MFNELVILIFFIANFQVYAKNDNNLKRDINIKRNLRAGVYDSFISLKNKLLQFFHTSFDKLEERRQRIKTAFYKFIYELFLNGNSARLSAPSFAEDVLFSDIPVTQMIVLHGYRVESHTVITSDGYMLTIHRVRPGIQDKIRVDKKIALLHHGLLGSSDDWVLLGTGRALPYLLSEAGCDVWLANARGNKHSRAHRTKSVDTPDYWDFSWHEIGQHDLSAVIEYIMDVTEGRLKIDFIGHSLGATALIVLLSSSPKFNSFLRSAIFLAPLVYMYQVKGPLKMLAKYHVTNTSGDLLGRYEFLPTPEFTMDIVANYCTGEIRMCFNPLLLLANGGKGFSDPYLAENVMSRVPAGGSTKTIVHYEQVINSGRFQAFDYGLHLNLKKYGMGSPRLYDLRNVKVPVVLFSSSDDWLATIPDVENLITKLPNLFIHHVVKRNDFSHTDFVWSEYAPELVYNFVLDILDRAELI